jgi:hypothetical protein
MQSPFYLVFGTGAALGVVLAVGDGRNPVALMLGVALFALNAFIIVRQIVRTRRPSDGRPSVEEVARVRRAMLRGQPVHKRERPIADYILDHGLWKGRRLIWILIGTISSVLVFGLRVGYLVSGGPQPPPISWLMTITVFVVVPFGGWQQVRLRRWRSQHPARRSRTRTTE